MQISSALAGVITHLSPPKAAHHVVGVGPDCACGPAGVPGQVLGIERQVVLRVIASEVPQALGGAPQQSAPEGVSGYGPSDPSTLGAVARALRAAIRDANGADPVPLLLGKIETGLASA